MSVPTEMTLSCPIPSDKYPVVTLAHGGGGRLMQSLIREIFYKAFDNQWLRAEHDGALLALPTTDVAFTTDAFVVSPLRFPGGDIGKLAVYGTINDLAMCGARPMYITASFIIEEGLEIAMLWQIALSMREACQTTGVAIVAGDTKVVEKGSGDGLFITTAGIGIRGERCLLPDQVKPGDQIVLSGDIGRHGIAVMAHREGLEFESEIESDCAPLADAVRVLLEDNIELHCLRDLTRGGLATVLCEIAEKARLDMRVSEEKIPLRGEVRGACEMLGLDPLYVACEGRFVAFVAASDAERALTLMKERTEDSAIIGEVVEGTGLVEAESSLGTLRALEILSGEQLPRIC